MRLLDKLVDWCNGGYTESSKIDPVVRLDVICGGRYDSRILKIEHRYTYLNKEYRTVRNGRLVLKEAKLVMHSTAIMQDGGRFTVAQNYGAKSLLLSVEMANNKLAEILRYDDLFLKTLA